MALEIKTEEQAEEQQDLSWHAEEKEISEDDELCCDMECCKCYDDCGCDCMGLYICTPPPKPDSDGVEIEAQQSNICWSCGEWKCTRDCECVCPESISSCCGRKCYYRHQDKPDTIVDGNICWSCGDCKCTKGCWCYCDGSCYMDCCGCRKDTITNTGDVELKVAQETKTSSRNCMKFGCKNFNCTHRKCCYGQQEKPDAVFNGDICWDCGNCKCTKDCWCYIMGLCYMDCCGCRKNATEKANSTTDEVELKVGQDTVKSSCNCMDNWSCKLSCCKCSNNCEDWLELLKLGCMGCIYFCLCGWIVHVIYLLYMKCVDAGWCHCCKDKIDGEDTSIELKVKQDRDHGMEDTSESDTPNGNFRKCCNFGNCKLMDICWSCGSWKCIKNCKCTGCECFDGCSSCICNSICTRCADMSCCDDNNPDQNNAKQEIELKVKQKDICWSCGNCKCTKDCKLICSGYCSRSERSDGCCSCKCNSICSRCTDMTCCDNSNDHQNNKKHEPTDSVEVELKGNRTDIWWSCGNCKCTKGCKWICIGCGDGKDAALHVKAPTSQDQREQLPDILAVGPDGTVYYTNDITKETQYNKPDQSSLTYEDKQKEIPSATREESMNRYEEELTESSCNCINEWTCCDRKCRNKCKIDSLNCECMSCSHREASKEEDKANATNDGRAGTRDICWSCGFWKCTKDCECIGCCESKREDIELRVASLTTESKTDQNEQQPTTESSCMSTDHCLKCKSKCNKCCNGNDTQELNHDKNEKAVKNATGLRNICWSCGPWKCTKNCDCMCVGWCEGDDQDHKVEDVSNNDEMTQQPKVDIDDANDEAKEQPNGIEAPCHCMDWSCCNENRESELEEKQEPEAQSAVKPTQQDICWSCGDCKCTKGCNWICTGCTGWCEGDTS